MFNHGIITGALFFLVGVIYEAGPSARIPKDVRGVQQQGSYYYGLFVVAAFTSLGLPGPGRFLERVLCLPGAFDIVPIWAVIGIIGVVLTAAYILWKIVQYTFLGQYDPHKIAHWTNVETGAEEHEPRDVTRFEKLTLWPLVAFMILFGIFPTPLLSFFDTASMAIMTGFVGK